jgi:hypothetical protein
MNKEWRSAKENPPPIYVEIELTRRPDKDEVADRMIWNPNMNLVLEGLYWRYPEKPSFEVVSFSVKPVDESPLH